MKHLSSTTLIAAAVAVCVTWGAPLATQAAEYYAGKSITVIVGQAAGGGTDTVARILTRFLRKYIPGNPKIIVRNMTGAGGSKSMNFVYEKARADGLTVVYSNLSPMQELLKAPGIRFEYGKFTWLGALKGAPLMMFARFDVVPGGMKKPADIVKAKKLILLGQRPDANLDLVARPGLDLFGLKYIYVPGYRGAVPRRAAMRRNEGNVTAHGLNGWRSGVEPTMGKQGIVMPLWYYPYKDDAGNYIPSPEIKKFPSILKVYREVFGKEPSGPYWDALDLAMKFRAASSNAFLAPPNTNKEAAAAFRKGFQGMMQDPDMKAALNKTTGFVMKPAKLEDVLNVFATLDQIDPKLTQFWKDYIAHGGKAKKAPKDKRGGKRKKK